ncbi:PAS domain S-box protein [Paraflavisolibacter sp. H34]|uniref:sensor histidine kinase n=1 Tax=Huijunlia imazamoxiresistens TaxID=3127457 RepID=UPI00301AC033
MEHLLQKHFDSGEWLMDLFDNAHDLIQIVHLDGTLIYVNESWAALLEYRREDIQGRSLFSFIDEADLSRYIHYRQLILSNQAAEKEITFHLKSKSGRRIAVEGFVSAKMVQGKPLYTRGIFRDVTTRLQQEAQLRMYNRDIKEKENNLQQLLIHAPDAVIVINRESCITFWNPKAEEIFGWTAEEVLQRPLAATIIPPQYREAHDRGMKRYLNTGQPHVLNQTLEITALKKSGREFFISLTISQTIQQGKIAFVAFIRDISQQKNNLQELQRKTQELERSNADLEDFAYAASHDMKEPIRKILIFSDRLKGRLESRLDEEDLRLFGRMETAAHRMRLLIEDLLAYSHVSREAGYLEEVDLNRKVHVVLDDLELEIQDRHARVRVGPMPVIKGHRRQLQQLFQNLIGNALKYSSPHRVPEIHVSSRLVTPADTALQLPVSCGNKPFHLIQVQDNGIGFEQRDAEKIFNVFTRLHTSEFSRGTGVGLSIVRKVVQNHQGCVWAESMPGQGTTFFVLLPEF